MRVLGIDYGTVRVGLAICDELGIVVTPYKVLPYSAGVTGEIAEIVRLERVERVVVGMPYESDGSESETMRRVGNFITKLRATLQCQVEEWDESFSSRQAIARMIEAGVGRKRRRDRANTDAWAAGIILREYLDSLG